MEDYVIIRDESSLDDALDKLKRAQIEIEGYTQERIDELFKVAAISANNARITLAQMAVDETGMGIVEDKAIKNHIACEFIYNKYKNDKTCGVIEHNDTLGIDKIAAPIGTIGAVIPVTNPTSTTIFKILMAIKTRNAIVISPHPKAAKSTIATAKIMLDAIVKAGAPKNIIAWVENPSLEITKALMSKVDMILATGGPGLVKSAYSSGRPAIGVGAGNTPVIIDESADLALAVSSIIHSKVFDNGMICASEQSVIVLEDVYEATKEEFLKRGAYFLNSDEANTIRELLFKDGSLNPVSVGKSAKKLAEMANINIDDEVKLLIAEPKCVGSEELLSHEKLCPVLSMYMAKTFDQAIDMASILIETGGLGHTASIYIDETANSKAIDAAGERLKVCRILINTPSSQGGVGDIYNFALPPSFTLGCGSWGGNSVCENVGIKQLMNIKSVATRRENMLWLKAPVIYMKKGCFSTAFEEMRDKISGKRVFIVTDKFLFNNGFLTPIIEKISKMDCIWDTFYNVEPDPTLRCVCEGTEKMRGFSPDVIIAFGGGSAMDCAKAMWLLYEHPDVKFDDISLRFCDIKKRIYSFPTLESVFFIAISTTSGTGSEVTPFTVITDEKSSLKYPIADYTLLPHVAIIDTDFHMSAPKSLTANTGMDALTHALEAYVSVAATDFTDALAIGAIQIIFDNLETVYNNGANQLAREKMANGATMAGIAFSNAFLGICHSMAHKLGSFYHLPHGVANALLIEQVIKFNCAEAPTRMGTFPQYKYPIARKKYARIARAVGVVGASDEELVNGLLSKIKELKQRLGIKSSIKEYGIEESEFLSNLSKMSLMAFDDQCTITNPRYPLVSEIEQLFLNAYYGK